MSGRLIRMSACLAGFFLSLVVRAASAEVRYSLDKVVIVGLGDSLAVTVNWSVNEGRLAPGAALILTPSLKGSMGEVALTSSVVYGSKVFYEGVKASGEPGEVRALMNAGKVSFSSSDVIAREEWMDTVKFCLTAYDWTRRNGKVMRSFSTKGVYTRPAEPEAPIFPWTMQSPARSKDSEKEIILSCPLVWEGEGAGGDVSMTGNEEFLEKLKALTSLRKFSVESVSLKVLVPPGRGVTSSRMKKMGQILYSQLQKSGCFSLVKGSVEEGGEDWDGVSGWLQRSPYADDIRIKEIIASADPGKGDVLRREKPAAWDDMAASCFPHLGRLDARVRVKLVPYASSWFVLSVMEQVPEVLTPYDFFMLASDYQERSERWYDVMSEGVSYCPDDASLNMDLTMALVKDGNARSASPYVRYCGDSPEGRYVYAVWLYHTGRMDECVEILSLLKESSQEYRRIWIMAEPYIKWYLGFGRWERSFN